MIRPHAVPEALVRDRRRGSWILVMSNEHFDESASAARREREPFAFAESRLPGIPGLTLHEMAARESLEPPEIDRTMIAILLGWVGVFCWMFYCLARL